MHRSGIATPLRDGLARTSRGFTLIEVLVALVIVAVTLGAGVKAAGALLNNTQRLTEITEAQWCADNELTGLRLGKIYPNVGDSTFNCQQLGRNYVGTFQVRATPNPNFRRVDATMVNEAGESMLTISTILPRY
jgi:general secretion pathway protein I